MAKGYICYIQSMLNQYGEDWIVRVAPENIQRMTKRIVKEIAKGSIDYEAVGRYMLDSKFLENLIIGISNELEINTLNLNACRFYYSYFPSTQNMGVHINHLERVNYIYMVILERLNFLKGTGNLGVMVDIPGLLFSDRKHFDTL